MPWQILGAVRTTLASGSPEIKSETTNVRHAEFHINDKTFHSRARRPTTLRLHCIRAAHHASSSENAPQSTLTLTRRSLLSACAAAAFSCASAQADDAVKQKMLPIDQLKEIIEADFVEV